MNILTCSKADGYINQLLAQNITTGYYHNEYVGAFLLYINGMKRNDLCLIVKGNHMLFVGKILLNLYRKS